MSRILVIDDDPVFAKSVGALARNQGHLVDLAATVAEAKASLAAHEYDLALLDLVLPDGSGLELQQEFDAAPHMRVMIVTGRPTLDSALQAANGNAMGYLQKPVSAEIWRNLLSTLGVPQDVEPGLLLGQSPAILQVIATLTRVAQTDARVLLTGESGTGKDLAARNLHAASLRSGAFVALNCGAVAPDLLASQLFGHERGSFTGAYARQIGVFEQAAHGTLFLDEVAEMPLNLQVFLLRALETGTVVRVGGHEAVPISARVVSATNMDLAAAMRQGRLREDLYYRLAEIEVHMPALRERGDDAVLLATAFIDQLNQRDGGSKFLLPASVPALRANPWHGNVRELRSAIRKAYLLQDGPGLAIALTRAQSEEEAKRPGLYFEIGTPLETIKRDALVRTLEHFHNDKTATAKALGISVRTVHNELARLRGLAS